MKRYHTASRLRRVWHRIQHRSNAVLYYNFWDDLNLGDREMWEAPNSLDPKTPLAPWIPQDRISKMAKKAGMVGGSYPCGIVGGGTLLNEPNVKHLKNFAGQCGRIYTLGTGIGSFGNYGEESPELTAFLKQHFESQPDRLMLRGPISRGKAEKMGIEGAVAIGDMACLRALEPRLPATSAKAVGVSFMDFTKEVGPEFPDACAEAVKRLVSEGYEPRFFAVSRLDEAFNLRVAQKAGVQTPVTLAVAHDAYLRFLAGVAGVMCHRLHGFVLALCAGKPSVSLAYRDKVSDFARQVDGEGLLADYSCGLKPTISAQSPNVLLTTLLNDAAPVERVYAACQRDGRTIKEAFLRITSQAE